MSTENQQRVVSAERIVAGPAAAVFELIADPAQQPRWDGNDNLAESAPGQRIRAVGEVFVTRLTTGAERANRVVDFDEARLIAWRPSPLDAPEPGHEWRWELFPVDGDDDRVRVVHTYDWTELDDPVRQERARATTSDKLRASINRLAALVEGA